MARVGTATLVAFDKQVIDFVARSPDGVPLRAIIEGIRGATDKRVRGALNRHRDSGRVSLVRNGTRTPVWRANPG